MSTKMLPIVAAILPLYVIVSNIGLLDNIWALVILYTSMNLPHRGVDDAVVLPRGARRTARSGQPGRRQPVASAARGDPAAGVTRYRGHRADLRDLRLERVLLRGQPHRGERSRPCRCTSSDFIAGEGHVLGRLVGGRNHGRAARDPLPGGSPRTSWSVDLSFGAIK